MSHKVWDAFYPLRNTVTWASTFSAILATGRLPSLV